MKQFGALVAILLLAGCAAEPPPRVEPPAGGEWAECPPNAARAIAVPFRANVTDDARGLGEGIHRVGPGEFLYVHASHQDTLREDRISRVNPVHVARDGLGVLHVCTRVDVVAPVEVDDERRSYDLAVLLSSPELPPGPYRVVVNWVAGCPCDPLPKGNATASFDG